MFQTIWTHISIHAKSFWSLIVAMIVVVLSFFGIRISDHPALPTYAPTSAVTSSAATSAAETSTETTAAQPTTTTKPTTTATPKPPQAAKWTFTRGDILGFVLEYDLEVVTQQSVLIPQPGGDPRTRGYTGIRLRDLLAVVYKVDLSSLGGSDYLRVEDSASAQDFATDYNLALMTAADTLLAWEEDFLDGTTEDVIRMCPKNGPAYQFVKNVDTITLYAANASIG